MAAGVVATSVTTFAVVVGASLGAPTLEAASPLVAFLAEDTPVGWTFHLLIGVGVAVVYATLFSSHLAGSAALRGTAFGALLWVASQSLWWVQPGNGSLVDVARLVIWSLPAHLIHGSLTGWLCGIPARHLPTSTRAHA